MGPDKSSHFKPVIVKGIHENRVDIEQAGKGASITISIKNANKKDPPLKSSTLKKGMYLIGLGKTTIQSKKGGLNPLEQLCIKEFDAEVKILHHATTIQPGYQSVIHCGGIRQAAKAIEIFAGNEGDKAQLRTGERGIIKFRFLYYAELLKIGSTIMFREGSTKGLGKVTKVYPMTPE